MTIETIAPTRGNLYDHIKSPPALPICFDSSSVLHGSPAPSPLDFVLGINALAWGYCNEVYPFPHREEIQEEWASVGHSVPAILSKWRNYGLFGTNIEGWFTIDSRDTDQILRAIALFGFALWVVAGEVKVLCGFHRSLGINYLGYGPGITFNEFSVNSEIYVPIPTIMAETDHPALSYLRYETLETN